MPESKPEKTERGPKKIKIVRGSAEGAGLVFGEFEDTGGYRKKSEKVQHAGGPTGGWGGGFNRFAHSAGPGQ